MNRRPMKPRAARRTLAALAAGVILALSSAPVPVGAATTAPPTTPTTTAGGGTTTPKAPPDKFPGLTDLATCIKDTDRLQVMVLMDQSGSLKKTDPGNLRVTAASSVLGGLASLSIPTPLAPSVKVDVQLAAFSDKYYPVGGWQALNTTTLPRLQTEIKTFAKRNTGIDTDFPAALQGATRAMTERTAAVTADGSIPPCRAVLLFTDGQYDIGVRTPAQVAALGRTKSYAPGVDLTTQAGVNQAGKMGVDALCAVGGIAEQARKRTAIISVPLTGAIDKRSLGLLEAMAVGGSKATGGCGKDVGVPRGSYLPASDVITLLERFDQIAVQIGGGSLVPTADSLPICQKSPCDSLQSVTVDASVTRVHLLTVVPRAGIQTQVTLPGVHDPLVVTPGRVATTVGSSSVRITPLSATAATIDITLGHNSAEWQGVWQIRFVDPEGASEALVGRLQVSVFSRIGVKLMGPQTLRVGEPGTVHAQLSGTGKNDALVAQTDITAVLTDPGTGKVNRAPLTADPQGGYSATFTLPVDIRTAEMRAQFTGTVTTKGGVVVEVNGSGADVAVLKPAVYPQVNPPRLLLPTIDGKGSTSGTLIITSGPFGSGCVQFIAPRFLGVPAASLPVTMEVSGATSGKCMKVPGRSARQLPVTFKVGGRATGTVRGVLTVVQRSDRDKRIFSTDVPFSFDVKRGIDRNTQVQSAVALMLIGTLVPILGLMLMNFVSTRFQAIRYVRAAAVQVIVMEGAVFRPNDAKGVSDPFNLYPADFQKLEGIDADKRRFTWAGLDFHARPNPNPFGEGWAEVVPEGGPAKLETREGTRVDLDLGLSGSWFFIYDPDMTLMATRAAKAKGNPIGEYPPEIHGKVIAFVADGPMRGQLSRLVPTILGNLPGTANRMVDLVRGKKATARRRAAAPTVGQMRPMGGTRTMRDGPQGAPTSVLADTPETEAEAEAPDTPTPDTPTVDSPAAAAPPAPADAPVIPGFTGGAAIPGFTGGGTPGDTTEVGDTTETADPETE